ncbi:MAG: glycosyltransferase family 39 protein [Lentisphaeria bacterium]|nr:glycosyltransferase family 39 protein [Lentisphaeria bacterium]
MDSDRFLRRVLWILAVFYVLRLLAGAFLPVFDPSEGRYASIAANMAASGDFLTPHLWHEGVFQSFDGKTPFFFWLAAGAIRIFGQNDFAVRLPSFLASLGMLAVCFLVLRRFRSPAETAWGLLFCGTGVMFYVFSGIVLTDMVLALCISGAILCFAAFLALDPSAKKSERMLWGLAVFAFLGVGFITKGPVAIVLFGVGPFFYLCFFRQWRKLSAFPWFTGFALFLLIAAPWFIAKWMDDPEAVKYFFYNENFKRFVSKEYGDKYGAGREMHFGASLWMLFLVTIPWCLVPVCALFHKESRKEFFESASVRDPLEGTILFAFLGMTAFWALTSRVLIYYMLPVIPCASLWLACRTSALGDRAVRFRRIALSMGALFCILTLGGLLGTGAALGIGGDASAYGIMRLADRLRHEGNLPEDVPFCFLREDPYSADFYNPGLALRHHPKLSAEESFLQNQDAILLSKKKYISKLPENARFREAGHSGKWVILIPDRLLHGDGQE